MPQNAAGWRIEPPVSEPRRHRGEPRRHRRRRAAARPAGDARRVPRVPGRARHRVLGRRPHGELVAVRLADDDGPGRGQPLDDGRVVGRDVAGEDARRRGGREPAGADVVLDRDRHPEQGQVRRVGPPPVERRRPREGRLRRGVVEGPQVPVAGRDATEKLGAHVDRGRAVAQRGPDVRDGRERGELHQPMTLGTLNSRSPPRSGALPNASSTGNDGRGSSSRMTGADVTGVGGGRDPRGVDAVQPLEIREDVAELAGELLRLRLGQLEVGEPRDAVDVGPRQGVGHRGNGSRHRRRGGAAGNPWRVTVFRRRASAPHRGPPAPRRRAGRGAPALPSSLRPGPSTPRRRYRSSHVASRTSPDLAAAGRCRCSARGTTS